MNQEALFARTLEQVKEQAAGQGGWIGEEEVQEAFAPLGLSGEQLQMVYDYLVKHKIGIGAPVNPDDYLTEEEKNYLQNYLDELESLPKADCFLEIPHHIQMPDELYRPVFCKFYPDSHFIITSFPVLNADSCLEPRAAAALALFFTV